MTQPLRIVFAGTPEFAARPLQRLLAQQWQPVAVYTQPDRPAGRGRKSAPSPVKQVALDAGIPVYQPATFRAAEGIDPVAQLADLQPDLMIVIAYGLLLPVAVLDTPRLGCVNVHASLLPRWRGAAPIQRAIEAGDAESGVTLMHMDAGLDTGPMIAHSRLALTADTTGGSLHDALCDQGSDLLLDFLPQADHRLVNAQAQPEDGVTYAKKLHKTEAQLNWHEPAVVLERRVRAFNPWPVTWFSWRDQPVRVWHAKAVRSPTDSAPGTLKVAQDELRIATAEGWLQPLTVQPAGKKPMPVADWLRGQGSALASGEVLS